MTAAVTRPSHDARPAAVLQGYSFELVAQWRIRLAVVACWIGPGVFVAAVSRQNSLATDTVFGRWMGQTGWAGSLVVLGFCCSWALPW